MSSVTVFLDCAVQRNKLAAMAMLTYLSVLTALCPQDLGDVLVKAHEAFAYEYDHG